MSEDEYGVEDPREALRKQQIKDAAAKKKAEQLQAQKQAEQQEALQKQKAEERKRKLEEEQKRLEEEDPEADMYDMDNLGAEYEAKEAVLQQAENTQGKVDEALTDTLVIFNDDTFFVNDFKTESGWSLGDLNVREIDDTQMIEEFSGTAKDIKTISEDSYNLMQTKGYFMPNLVSPIVTEEFVTKVQNDEIWLPMSSDVMFQSCVFPPKMNKLKQMLSKACLGEQMDGKTKALGELLKKHSADRPWMLGMLALVDPHNYIFQPPQVPESCSIAAVNQYTREFHGIFTGGIIHGQSQSRTIGFGVMQSEKNATKIYLCQFLKELPGLPTCRYLHQSVVLRQSNFQLYVIGGKINSGDWRASGGKNSPEDWTNSVQCLNLDPYFGQGKAKLDKDGKMVKQVAEWEDCASMNHARANFAAITCGNAIYVFGGISGADGYHPVLVKDPIEKYLPQTNSWEIIDIPNVPTIASFSWTQIQDAHGQILVLGGTDGNLLQADLYHIDFQENKVMQLPSQMDSCTGMGVLLYNQKPGQQHPNLHLIGGLNSGGQNYWKQANETQWKEDKWQHSIVANEKGMELINNAHVYFAK